MATQQVVHDCRMAGGTCECGRSYPQGYYFRPTDEDNLYYLKKRINNEEILIKEISEVNLYEHHPQTIAENCPRLGDNAWYVFTPRDRKYKNGSRPSRAAGAGFWKATGKDKAIRSTKVGTQEVILGHKKALAFLEGKPSDSSKTNWSMHEYTIDRPQGSRRGSDDMKLDDWVLCRIYEKADRRRDDNASTSGTPNDESQQNPEENIEVINVEGETPGHQGYENSDPLVGNEGTLEVPGIEDHDIIMEQINSNATDDVVMTNNTMPSYNGYHGYNYDLQTQSQNIGGAALGDHHYEESFPLLDNMRTLQIHGFENHNLIFRQNNASYTGDGTMTYDPMSSHNGCYDPEVAQCPLFPDQQNSLNTYNYINDSFEVNDNEAMYDFAIQQELQRFRQPEDYVPIQNNHKKDDHEDIWPKIEGSSNVQVQKVPNSSHHSGPTATGSSDVQAPQAPNSSQQYGSTATGTVDASHEYYHTISWFQVNQ